MTTSKLRNAANAAAAIFLSSAGVAMVLVPQPLEARSPSAKPVVVTAPERDTDTVRRSVYYGDLNLASMSGEKMLNERVASAVRGVCREITGPNADLHIDMACRWEASAFARPQVSDAVQRAREIASTGKSSIAAAAIVISFK
jgi:UrcA family protein